MFKNNILLMLIGASILATNSFGSLLYGPTKTTQNFTITPKYTMFTGTNGIEDTDGFSFDFGYKVKNNMSIVIPYSQVDIEKTGMGSFEAKRYGTLVSYESFFSKNTSMNAKFGYIFEEIEGEKQDAIMYGIDLNYYFSNSMGLVFSYERNELDNTFSNENMSFGLKVKF